MLCLGLVEGKQCTEGVLQHCWLRPPAWWLKCFVVSKTGNNAWSSGLPLVGSGASSWQQLSLSVQCFCDKMTSSRVFESGRAVELTISAKRQTKIRREKL